MNDSELNEYIYHYLTKDKTKGAILLTAPWGTGKSYYIQNVLKPFLEKNEEPHKCIVVSLYDVSNTSELSKSLYFEKRFHSMKKNKIHKKIHAIAKPVVEGLFGVGKTVLKSITPVDLDFNVIGPNWEELIDSVNFNGDLVVLEDLERTKINIEELLGYVNNLVEQDGIKVLLVANEHELIKGEPIIEGEMPKGGKTATQIQYNQEEEAYLRTKEKTISDTIHFLGDNYKAIENILISFKNKWFDLFLKKRDEYSQIRIVNEIIKIMDTVKDYNLRSVIFGCQKTVDMFQYVDSAFDPEFLQYLLCSNVAFSLRLKQDDSITWDMNDLIYSSTLGTYHFPLTRNAYDYIKHQHKIDEGELKSYNDTYCSRRAFEKAQGELEPFMKTIYNYYIYPENKVIEALDYITRNLETTKDIPYSEYGTLANYLVAIHQVLKNQDTIVRSKTAMLKQLSTNTDPEVEDRISFHGGIQLETSDAKQEFADWKAEMLDIIKNTVSGKFNFDYDPEKIYDFNTYVHEHQNKYYTQHKFAALINVGELIDMLKIASPEQIWVLSGIFSCIYYIGNVGEFLGEDRPALMEIKKRIDILRNSGEIQDQIALLQLKYLSNNLQSYIDKLQ